MTPAEINSLIEEIKQINISRGWFDEIDSNAPYKTLQLILCEVSEATEGDRSDSWDIHLSHRKSVEVETADIFIRLAGLAGAFGWSYERTEFHQGLHRFNDVPTMHFFLSTAVCSLGMRLFDNYRLYTVHDWRIVMSTVLEIARREGYHILSAVREKLEFNETRALNDSNHFGRKRY